MQVSIEPSSLKGNLQVPASKSMMQRACAAALLQQGKTTIFHPGSSDDDKAALDIISRLGANVIQLENSIEISSSGIYPKTDLIDCRESGLSARMFLPVIAMSNKRITVTGSGTLLNRPMHILDELLPKLGVDVKSNKGHLPFSIKGPLRPQAVTLDGSTSSQFLTGFLFAFSQASEPVTINVENLKSRPYIDMTLEVLELFGKPINHEQYERFIIDPSHFEKRSDIQLSIEADWSSAAFWLVAGAIAGYITLHGPDVNSKQADKAILNVLTEAGAHAHINNNNSITISQANNLQGFSYDATNTPDLFPILAVLAGYCKGESRIKGTHRLLHKESNRLDSICDMLKRFGVNFSTEEDELVITGGSLFRSCEISSYHDHRIAMAAAVAALRAEGTVIINDADAVSKSYPDFFSDLSLLGGKLHINNTNS